MHMKSKKEAVKVVGPNPRTISCHCWVLEKVLSFDFSVR